jgi:predicted porin
MRSISVIKTAGWITLFVICVPWTAQAAELKTSDWLINVGGELRISYNKEDCDDACQDIWRSPDTDTGVYEDSSEYLTGDISTVSISGNRQMENGIKAVFNSEWRIDVPEGDDDTMFSNFEQYIGIDAPYGLVRAGTVETPYMQTGKLIDPFTRDALSTRFFVDIQSALHHSNGKGRGRSTNTIRYDSPISKSGVTLQLFTGIDNSGDDENSLGGGVIYTSQNMSLFAQYYDNGESGDDEAYKIGGKLGSNNFSIFGQYEFDEGLISLSENLSSLATDTVNTAEGDNTFEKNKTSGADVWFVGASYNTGKTVLLYEYGERKDSDGGRLKKDGHKGWLAGMKIQFDKYVYLYLGYLEKEYNASGRDKDTRYTIGASLIF